MKKDKIYHSLEEFKKLNFPNYRKTEDKFLSNPYEFGANLAKKSLNKAKKIKLKSNS